jgi:hypothetical protein
MRATWIAAISGLAIGLVSVSARAGELASSGDSGGWIGDPCTPVNAPIVTAFFLEGCTSPFGLCTQGEIASGVLAGTTRFAVVALQPGDSPELLLYTGELVITTPSGDLTIQDRGVLNAADGSFFEFDEIFDGTRAFTGVSGLLFSQGTSTPTGFDGTISGQVCGGPPGPPVLD